MKEYKHNEELLEYLKSKNGIIDDENIALNIGRDIMNREVI